MAQAKLKWESLPNDLRDINVFQPVIAQVMLMRFPSTQGYRHQILGNTEYRVRRGMFGGWDVRVWRQEHLIIDVSAGSRFNSALPIIAGLLALAGVAVLDGFNYLSNAANFPSILASHRGTPRIGLLLIASWTVLFLVIWGGLSLMIRPIIGAVRQENLDQEILEEIRRTVPGLPLDGR